MAGSVCKLFKANTDHGEILNHWSGPVVATIHKGGQNSVMDGSIPVSPDKTVRKMMENFTRIHILQQVSEHSARPREKRILSIQRLIHLE